MNKHALLIVDDIFPSERSPFRYEEFSKILKSIPDTYVVTSGAALAYLEAEEDIFSLVNQYTVENPELKDRIIVSTPSEVLDKMDFHLAYTVFLNNIYANVALFEAKKIPFVFTLYPGGGFAFDNEESDQKLERVFQSPCFRKVIVNEEVTKDYLLRKGLCHKREICCIHGVVIPQKDILNAQLRENPIRRQITMSFCAYKYSEAGKDKGYDFFVAVAKKLLEKGMCCKCHVIGNFCEDDVELGSVKDCFIFHGIVSGDKMWEIFRDTDFFISPMRAGILAPGSFNGFPTAASVTAALCGALVMTSDPLNQNREFISGENIEIITLDAETVAERIAFYCSWNKQFNAVRRKQIEKFLSLYSNETQMTPRVNLLQEEINWSKCNTMNNLVHPRQSRIEIPIMHCFDNNYVIPATASFYSMLKYANPDYDYRLFVLHSDITTKNQKMLTEIVERFPNAALEFINMSNRFDDIWQQTLTHGHYTKELFYKLLIASIFPQYDKILITDVDVVFRGDISKSYFALEPDEKVCFAGVHQVAPKGTFLETFYEGYKEKFGPLVLQELKICGGYLLANLKYIRESKKEAQFLKYMSDNVYRLRQPEQDVINFCCKDSEVKFLPLANVVCTYMYDIFADGKKLHDDPFFTAEELQEAMEHPIQVHYATGTKPWKDLMCTKADWWLQDLAEAGAYYEYMRKKNAGPSPESVPVYTLGRDWKANNSSVTVSVLCCSYNHEKFIRKALEGIVNQKTKFAYEVIVADDASTDETQKIIREFAEKYPDKIHCILREKNVGIGPNYFDALQQVKGKYLAICDGDDYWSDPEKLQRQVDYMEAHPDYTVCCASFVRHEHRGDEITEVPFAVEDYIKTVIPEKESYSFEDLLYCRFIASCTAMVRWQYHGRVPEFIKHYPVIDFPIMLLHAAGGRIGVMHDYSPSVYNVHIKSVTNTNSQTNLQMIYKCLLYEIDQYLDYRFNATISEYLNGVQTGIFKLKPVLERKQKSAVAASMLVPASAPVVQAITEADLIEDPSTPGWKRAYLKYTPKPVKKIYRCTKKLVKMILRFLVMIIKLLYREIVPNIIQRVCRIGIRAIKKIAKFVIIKAKSVIAELRR